MASKEVSKDRPAVALIGELASRAGQLTDDAVKQEISAQIIDRIVEADNAADVLALGNQTLQSGQDMVNRPHKPLAIGVRPSGKKGGLGVYLVIDALFKDTGSVETFGIGAATAVAQYTKLEKLGYAGDVVLREKSTTTDGNAVLYLEAA